MIVCFRLRNPESGLSAFFGIIRFRLDLDWPNLNGVRLSDGHFAEIPHGTV